MATNNVSRAILTRMNFFGHHGTEDRFNPRCDLEPGIQCAAFVGLEVTEPDVPNRRWIDQARNGLASMAASDDPRVIR